MLRRYAHHAGTTCNLKYNNMQDCFVSKHRTSLIFELQKDQTLMIAADIEKYEGPRRGMYI